MRRMSAAIGILIGMTAIISTSKAQQAPEDHPLPVDCQHGTCSAPQEKIWQGFTQAGALETSSTQARVFSGECYHRSPDLDPEQTHYGVAYIDRKNGELHFHGQFSFYSKQNPYASWTPEQAAASLPLKYTETTKIQTEMDYAWLDFNPGQLPVWQYYLRQSAQNHDQNQNQTLWLVSYWGTERTIFCELNENQPSQM